MEDFHEYKVICRFPLMAASEDLKKWTGFLSTAMGKTVRISLIVPEFPAVGGIHLDQSLEEDARSYWEGLMEQMTPPEEGTLLQFLESLEAQVHQRWDASGASRPEEVPQEGGITDAAEMFTEIIAEVEMIGLDKVVSLSSDFKEIELKHLDRSQREHKLKLVIPEGYPTAKPTVLAELPFPGDSLQWPARIKEIHQMWIVNVDKCCAFWDDMEELDSTVRVVDPLNPSKEHSHRRILLEDNVIMHLILNPLRPRALPQVNFAGPEKHVDSFNAAIDKECDLWDETRTVLQNLRSILNCQFVSQDEEEELEEQAPCAICYVYNFEDEIPEILCDCSAAYHKQCLQDLFLNANNVPTTAITRRFVECPSCQMEIRVPAGFAAGAW